MDLLYLLAEWMRQNTDGGLPSSPADADGMLPSTKYEVGVGVVMKVRKSKFENDRSE